MIKLYSYFRSSAAFRVRIALHYKGLKHEIIPIHLLKEGGEHLKSDFKKLNPQGLVPVLVSDDGEVISQSMSILEYLEEMNPTPSLLPTSHVERSYVRTLANMVVCDIHPLNNLRVLRYLKHELKLEDESKNKWITHWIHHGFQAIESTLAQSGASLPYCLGDTPTFADVCLIPQVYNALRNQCKMDAFPTIQKIYENCMKLEAFKKAAPENQIDYEQTP